MVSDGDEGLGGAGSTAAGLGIEIRSMSARRLVVFQGRELGRPYVLDGHQTIGRSSENKICLNEDSVSRRHAEVLVDGTSVLLRDLSSTNGTYVNDQRLDDSVGLKNGDLIQIGKTVVKYFDGSNVESSYLATISDQATRDRTTGTYNRHHFDDRLADTHRNVWPGRPSTLVLVEIPRSSANSCALATLWLATTAVSSPSCCKR